VPRRPAHKQRPSDHYRPRPLSPSSIASHSGPTQPPPTISPLTATHTRVQSTPSLGPPIHNQTKHNAFQCSVLPPTSTPQTLHPHPPRAPSTNILPYPSALSFLHCLVPFNLDGREQISTWLLLFSPLIRSIQFTIPTLTLAFLLRTRLESMATTLPMDFIDLAAQTGTNTHGTVHTTRMSFEPRPVSTHPGLTLFFRSAHASMPKNLRAD
jgi:hypothetical protein